MNPWSVATAAVLGARLLGELIFETLNQRLLVRLAAGEADAATGSYANPPSPRALDYARARSRFRLFSVLYETVVLAVLLGSGVLPRAWRLWQGHAGTGLWADAAFLWSVFALTSVAHWPLSWYERFRLEQRFGFNTATARTWWSDRFKGIVLGALLGLPTLWALLACIRHGGSWWWLGAWAGAVGLGLLLNWVAPVLILPWFHRFDPLPEGPLRDRLERLARRTGFPVRDIQIMDGSRRTRHSNAFFTGWGRSRRVVLYDTLVGQLGTDELEAVVAHEIGHARLGHVRKLWIVTAGIWALAFAGAAWAREQPDFYRAFGFEPGNPAPVLLILGLCSGPLGWWLSPWIHARTRRWEFEADAFAARALDSAAPLRQALERLHRENLAEPPLHPWYRFWHESHPPLADRLRALAPPAGDPSSC